MPNYSTVLAATRRWGGFQPLEAGAELSVCLSLGPCQAQDGEWQLPDSFPPLDLFLSLPLASTHKSCLLFYQIKDKERLSLNRCVATESVNQMQSQAGMAMFLMVDSAM